MQKIETLCCLILFPCHRTFARFFCLAVEDRLIYVDRSVQNDAIDRHFVSCLQEDAIALHEVVDSNFLQTSFPIYLTVNERCLFLQFLECILVPVLRICGDKRREQDGERNADRLEPCRLP